MSTHSSALPGWYADPAMLGMLRWWDGQQWSPVQQPLRLPQQPRRPVPVPRYAGKNERLGRLAMLSEAAVSILVAGSLGYLFRVLFTDFVRFVDDAQAAPAGEVPTLPWSFFISAVLISAVGLLALVPVALLIAWTYRCATSGASLQIPASREPEWAAVGWIIPVLGYWFPYQSVRDCLPADHPQRPTVGWWWGGMLTASHTLFLVFGATLLGTVPFLIMLVIHAGIAIATAMAGLKVVRAIDEAHRAALAAREEADAR